MPNPDHVNTLKPIHLSASGVLYVNGLNLSRAQTLSELQLISSTQPYNYIADPLIPVHNRTC